MYRGESTRSTNTDAALIGTGPARVGATAAAAVVGVGALAVEVGCGVDAGEHAAASRVRLTPSASRASSRRLKRVTADNVTLDGSRRASWWRRARPRRVVRPGRPAWRALREAVAARS